MSGVEILWLGDEACQDPSRVGGKAANLSRLSARHTVPAGFCVAAAAVAPGGGEARSGAAKLPRRLQSGIEAAYGALAAGAGESNPAVAVRSSALDEDGDLASFAGQHETYLNVTGADAVAQAVARCWASATSDRALQYRRLHGLSHDDVRIAVLVQHLVPADVSLVIFSANPVTGSRDEVVVNATWGLGESLVSGLVTPDSFVLRRRDLAIEGRRIGEKAAMTVQGVEGTREVSVPRLLRARPTLSDSEVVEAGKLALDLERAMGWPVDVEAAFFNGKLYLLQCRPVTTVREAPPAAPERGDPVWPPAAVVA